jgi:phytoene dehydrogenase-like protein
VQVVTFQDKSVVIVGGGHNGLTAAAYLAKAGVKVTVLERLSVFGGAAISAQAFDGIDARLSRYSYLVSLLPKQIIQDLELDISLAPRRYSSYTPIPGEAKGLLVDNQDESATRASFEALGAKADFASWRSFYSDTQALAKEMWPSVLEPLQRRSDWKAGSGNPELWEKFIERPVGNAIQDQFKDDWVRGVVYTDALIGTFASNSDQTLNANKCFLYHVIGGGTGDWNVPIGGMGAVSGELQRAAKRFGAELVSDAEVLSIETRADCALVRYLAGGQEHEVSATLVLANSSRQELAKLMGQTEPQKPIQPTNSKAYPYGAQVKVNLLLKRLPKLRDGSVSPEAAFGGTFHINESFEQLQSAYEVASRGEIPNPMPCEIYCHSLTDPSILGAELRASGAQTLTVFALHAPHSLVANLSEAEHDLMRARLEAAVLSSLNSVLAEPIEELLVIDGNGNPCIETKTTRDLEEALRLPGGNIFHEPLSWPFAEDDDSLETPAERWGVATSDERILLCGSSAKRGGAVSGIAGHNAAMAALGILG